MGDTADVNAVTAVIVDAAMGIHRELGPGLLESVYEALLARTLLDRGLAVRRQAGISLSYHGVELKEAFRVDLLVEECVVVELKAAARMERVFAMQVLTYLRILNLPVGLVINFGAPTLKQGLKRVINNHCAAGKLSALPFSSPERDVTV